MTRRKYNMLRVTILSNFLALLVLISCVDTKLEDVDILFLSKLRASLRDVPRETRCSFIRRAVSEKLNEQEKEKGSHVIESDKDILAHVCDMLEAKKTFAGSSLISFLSECIQDGDEVEQQKVSDESVSEISARPDRNVSDNNDDGSGSQETLQATINGALNESPVNCCDNNDALLRLERDKYAQLFAEHQISVSEFKEAYAELISLKVKVEKLESENRLLKSERTNNNDDLTSYLNLNNKIKRLKEELRESFESSLKKELNYDLRKKELVSDLELARAKSEQCEKRIVRINEALEIHKQNLLSCLTGRAKLVAEHKDIQSKCDQQVIGLSELVERYKLKAQENEKNDKIVVELKAKIVNLKSELDVAIGKAKYCTSMLGEVYYPHKGHPN